MKDDSSSCINGRVRFTWGNCCVGKGGRVLSIYSSKLSYNPTLVRKVQKYHKWNQILGVYTESDWSVFAMWNFLYKFLVSNIRCLQIQRFCNTEFTNGLQSLWTRSTFPRYPNWNIFDIVLFCNILKNLGIVTALMKWLM